MAKRRAKDEQLGELHELLCGVYLQKLKDGTITGAEMSTLVKFLKDNRIESNLETGSKAEALTKALPSFTNDEDPHEDYQRHLN